ncbi:MAG: LytR/AlgR family response regulator transcription factor [Flavobacterium sp.]
MKIKAIIVDDENHARLALHGILTENFPEVEVIDQCKDVPEAVKAIHKHQPDVVFLDISMPGYSGLEIVDFLDTATMQCKIIFVTAHAEFAIHAFEMNAIDYLLKPIRVVALERALQKIKANTIAIENLKQHLSTTSSQKIALQTGDGVLFLELSQIIYLKADGSYTHFYTIDGKKITISKKLAEFEKLEQMGNFMRIHRSHLINLDQMERYLKQDGGTVVMKNGAMLSISNEKKQALMDLFLGNKL